MRLLTRRFGTLENELQQRLQQLSTVQMEDLSEALLDFSNVGDLVTWLSVVAPNFFFHPHLTNRTSS